MEKKFKLWAKADNIMFYAVENKPALFYNKDIDKYAINWLWRYDLFDILQWTWLKDKNWVEIYEWDFVQYPWNSRYWEVFFDDKNYQFRVRIKDRFWDINTYPLSEDMIVVWNIYETPKLLNQ